MVKIKNDDEMRDYLRYSLKKIASSKCKEYSHGTTGWLRSIFGGYDERFADVKVIHLAIETLCSALAYYRADDLYKKDNARCGVGKLIDNIEDFKNREMLSVIRYIAQDVPICQTQDHGFCCSYANTIELAQITLKNLELE